MSPDARGAWCSGVGVEALREIKLLRELSHDNVISLLDVYKEARQESSPTAAPPRTPRVPPAWKRRCVWSRPARALRGNLGPRGLGLLLCWVASGLNTRRG